ncbi:right-handed parallel beta-helix repeat-containing protein [Paenibacillus sinopodophylli]|uniref:right-handed parallel beta-helix repeat-containing protein n=1 Tax=Paenibacillus sinopodophylli TaxID=1837342 RepID=UPI00110CAE3A|nr:right-handed parallel beta-helix repeat-containing protein [Paenibacillus sinopodophylli]
MAYVPQSPLTDLYTNTTPGTAASSAAMDAAIQAIVNTTNENFDYVSGLVSTSVIARLNIYSVTQFGAIGNGIADDTNAIQAALNAAFTGSIVYVPIGTYLITQILQIPSTATLLMNPSAVIKRGSSINAMLINKSDGTIGGYNAGERIKVIGGIFDGNLASFPTACTAVGFAHATDILIKDVKFVNVPIWHMIEFNAVKRGVIQGCAFDNNAGVGATEMIQLDLMLNSSVFPWFGPYDETLCYDITIEECTFTNGVDGIGTHSAKLNTNHNYIRIINNRFELMSGSAIKTLNYSGVIITGNHFINCQKGIFASVQASISKGYTIANNMFFTMSQRAIQIGTNVRDGIIQGNTISVCGTHGIGVDLSQNWIIDSNNVQSCGQVGIWSYASDNVTISNNVSIGNNTGGFTDRFDINVGFLTTPLNQYNKVMGNHVGTLGLDYTNRTIMTNNVLTGALTNKASNTNGRVFNNFIAGTWTP